MSITSEEVNYLVLRYLRESVDVGQTRSTRAKRKNTTFGTGFKHASFAFQFETQLDLSEFDHAHVLPGALLNVLQKGIQYMDLETHVNDDGTIRPCGAGYHLIGKHHCEEVTTSTSSGKKKASRLIPSDLGAAIAQQAGSRAPRAADSTAGDPTPITPGESMEAQALDIGEDKDAGKSLVPPQAGSDGPATALEQQQLAQTATEASGSATIAGETADSTTQALLNEKSLEKMQIDDPVPTGSSSDRVSSLTMAPPSSIPASSVLSKPNSRESHPPLNVAVVLRGHEDKVCACAWNPVNPRILATGSYDATARIWSINPATMQLTGPSIRLDHQPALDQDNRYVTALEWDASGTLLATGAFDGQGRIWTLRGELRFALPMHQGPILAIKWSPQSSLLASTGVDGTVQVWDAKTGEKRAGLAAHNGAVLDVVWINDETFATGSADETVRVFQVSESGSTASLQLLRTLSGHKGGINALQIDPTERYLATASDDKTAKIWSVTDGKELATLTGHRAEVYSLEWNPIAKMASNVPSVLATCSLDHTVRIWDALASTCLYVLDRHTEPVFSVSFSPNGRYLVSGSLDRAAFVWSTKSGKLLKGKECPASVFEVRWSPGGDFIACCLADNTAVVMDGKMTRS
ncbi:hypothetical protein H4R34_001282 [Dimargaris verticillata]|uniref:WD40 repeat-like protein n=1 Tax=Dimargaris verticillata TaxID=2761393 RepID=A0A9W8BAB4_9FUNG|nr:hypothetical protein H4R34_001282 [Dimargaris verticillata]